MAGGRAQVLFCDIVRSIMISLDEKAALAARHGRSKKDVGSPEVQAAVFTARIQQINAHLQTAKKDRMARRGLLQLVGKRRRLLAYLARRDYEAYRKLLKALNLRK